MITKRCPETLEILRHDGTGIPARTIQGTLCDLIEDLDERERGGLRQGVLYGAEGKRHVRPGITVRHGKHIDAIDIVAPLEQMPDARVKCAQQSRTVDVGYGGRSVHQANFFMVGWRE